jgi:hypothetical protein
MPQDFILSGSEEALKPIITMLIAMNQLLENKDIGQFLGESIEEYARANPHNIKLQIVFYSVKSPPWRSEDLSKKLHKATYQIPDIDKRKITWSNIKTACGGKDGYMWGRFRATANLDNGRQMQVYGGTEKDAETRLKELLALSKAKILTLTVAEEKKEGRRAADQYMYKPSVRMYPAFFSIINSKKIIKKSNKQLLDGKRRSKLSGDYVEYGSGKIQLWVEKEPSTAKQMINSAFLIPPD